MNDRIDELAVAVRDEAERMTLDLAVATGHAWNRRLAGWCAVVAAALVAVYRADGFEAEIAGGYFEDGEESDPHCWAMVKPRFVVVPEQWTAYAEIVDGTATQFPRFEARPVVRLPPGDAARDHYKLGDLGDEVLHHQPGDDIPATLALLARLERRLDRAPRALVDLIEAPW